MGDPKKTKKQYQTPRKPHDKERLGTEKVIVKKYGLKNKRELWKFETILRKKRENARKLLALPLEERLRREQELVGSLARLGLLTGNATLDDVLTLTTESILERRLQTIVLRKGLANTATQARQFVVHGHIAVEGKRVTAPSFLVLADQENKIKYYGKPMEVQAKMVKETKKAFEDVVPKGAAAKPEEKVPKAAEEKKEEVKEAEKKAKVEAPVEETKTEKKEEAAEKKPKAVEEKKEEKPAVEEAKTEAETPAKEEKKKEVKADE